MRREAVEKMEPVEQCPQSGSGVTCATDWVPHSTRIRTLDKAARHPEETPLDSIGLRAGPSILPRRPCSSWTFGRYPAKMLCGARARKIPIQLIDLEPVPAYQNHCWQIVSQPFSTLTAHLE